MASCSVECAIPGIFRWMEEVAVERIGGLHYCRVPTRACGNRVDCRRSRGCSVHAVFVSWAWSAQSMRYSRLHLCRKHSNTCRCTSSFDKHTTPINRRYVHLLFFSGVAHHEYSPKNYLCFTKRCRVLPRKYENATHVVPAKTHATVEDAPCFSEALYVTLKPLFCLRKSARLTR